MPPHDPRRGLPTFVRSADDLITAHEAIREGFLAQALAKTEKADPYVENAKQLLMMLRSGEGMDSLLQEPTYRNDLLAAAGLSTKAAKHFTATDLDNHARAILNAVIQEAGSAWPEEIIYRYLLTKGDTLGGEMRNWTGANAQRKLSSAIKGFLPSGEVTETINAKSGKLTGLKWDNKTIYFDAKPMFLNKSVDVILLRTTGSVGKMTLENPSAYLACGELKGGIDPAGADEHWKTARSSLDRIRKRFNALGTPVPSLFFVGAAIERSMAEEIFSYLEDGQLDYAANLTVDEQLQDLAHWLVSG